MAWNPYNWPELTAFLHGEDALIRTAIDRQRHDDGLWELTTDVDPGTNRADVGKWNAINYPALGDGFSGIYVPPPSVAAIGDVGFLRTLPDGTVTFVPLEGVDELVKVTSTELAADYLYDQLMSSDGSILISVVGAPGADQTVDLTATAEDEKVKVTATEAAADYLSPQMSSVDTSVTLAVLGPVGGNQTLDLHVPVVDDDDLELDVNGDLSIKDDGVHDHHLNADVAGAGLSQDVNGALDVNCDAETMQIVADAVDIQDDGVHDHHLNPDVAGAAITQDINGALDVDVKNSIEINADELQLVGDLLAPGNSKYYGTNGAGVKSFYDLPAGGGAPAMIRCKEDMAADDTDYDCVYLEADGTEGAALHARRPPGVHVSLSQEGFLGIDSSAQSMFIPAIGPDDDDLELDAAQLMSIKDDGVHDHHLHSDTAGDGLTQDVNGALAVDPKNSVEVNADEVQLVNDVLAPGNWYFYGTSGAGAKGFATLASWLVSLAGYNAAAKQYLGHSAAGVLTWYDVQVCV